MKNQMSEKRTAKGSSRTLLLFFLSILLSGRSGSEPPAAESCRRSKIGNLDFPDLLGNSKPVQVCPACEVVISKHSLCVPTAAACKGNPLYPFTGGGVMPHKWTRREKQVREAAGFIKPYPTTRQSRLKSILRALRCI